MAVTERIKQVRTAEGLSQAEFCAEVGLKIDSYRKMEQGEVTSIRSTELEKITTHPRFEKYALWLVTGKTAPKAGQISPDIEQRRTA